MTSGQRLELESVKRHEAAAQKHAKKVSPFF